MSTENTSYLVGLGLLPTLESHFVIVPRCCPVGFARVVVQAAVAVEIVPTVTEPKEIESVACFVQRALYPAAACFHLDCQTSLHFAVVCFHLGCQISRHFAAEAAAEYSSQIGPCFVTACFHRDYQIDLHFVAEAAAVYLIRTAPYLATAHSHLGYRIGHHSVVIALLNRKGLDPVAIGRRISLSSWTRLELTTDSQRRC